MTDLERAAFRRGAEKMREMAVKQCNGYAKQNHVQAIKILKRGDAAGHDILDSCKREAEALASVIAALTIPEE